MFKRRNPNVPLALECALLFLAVAIFSWGVQAKVSLYSSDPGNSALTSFMAKLSTERGSSHVVASAEDRDQPRFTVEVLHFVDFAVSMQSNSVPPANSRQSKTGPDIAGRYNLHGPDRMRRPPPVFA